MFCDHNGIKLQIDDRKMTGKSLNTLKLNIMLLNNAWVEDKSSVEKID